MGYGFAIFILVVATFFWGSTFAFNKELVPFVSPMLLMAIRFILGSFILLVMFYNKIISSLKCLFQEDSKKIIPRLIFLGILNVAAIFLQTAGLLEIDVSNSGFITSLSVLFVPFIERFFRGRPVTDNIKIAVIIAIAGIYLISHGVSLPTRFVMGDFLTLMCAVVYSVYFVLVDSIAKRNLHSGVMMFVVFVVTSVICSIYSILFNMDEIHNLLNVFDGEFRNLFNFLSLVIFGTVIPYFLMGVGQKIVNAQTASLIYILEPIFAMALSMLFFSESPTVFKFVGGGVILFAQFVGLRKKQFLLKNVLKSVRNTKCKAGITIF